MTDGRSDDVVFFDLRDLAREPAARTGGGGYFVAGFEPQDVADVMNIRAGDGYGAVSGDWIGDDEVRHVRP